MAAESGATSQPAGNSPPSQCHAEGRNSWLQPHHCDRQDKMITATRRPWRPRTLLSATPPTPANSTLPYYSSYFNLKMHYAFMVLWLSSMNGLISTQHREDQDLIFLQLPFRHIQHVSAFIMRGVFFPSLHKDKLRVSGTKVTLYDSNIFNTSRLPGGSLDFERNRFP